MTRWGCIGPLYVAIFRWCGTIDPSEEVVTSFGDGLFDVSCRGLYVLGDGMPVGVGPSLL